MTPRLLILAFVPFLMASSGCRSYGTTSAEHETSAPSQDVTALESDTTFALSVDESANLARHTIAFREIVEDSRCPRGVDCVWEGRVVVALEIDGERIELSNHEQDENHTYTLDNGTLVLETVNPYPDAEDPSNEEPEAVIEWVKEGKRED